MTAAECLKDWVAEKHAGQRIRRSKEPYLNHLVAVANLAKPMARLGYEIGLCHDLLEDTDTRPEELRESLLSFGYSEEEAAHITGCVLELTDVFTASAFPDLSKKKRKKKESARLVGISADAQTVKYADLIYNIGWVLQYDQKNAKRYLHKKKRLLDRLKKGNEALRRPAMSLIAESQARPTAE